MKQGATLLESLVVIAVIGVLVAVVLITLNPLTIIQKTKDAAKLVEVNNLRRGLDLGLVDPATVNNVPHNYRFAWDGETYEINCQFESVEYQSKYDSDGGNDSEWYEIGTNPGLTLLPLR